MGTVLLIATAVFAAAPCTPVEQEFISSSEFDIAVTRGLDGYSNLIDAYRSSRSAHDDAKRIRIHTPDPGSMRVMSLSGVLNLTSPETLALLPGKLASSEVCFVRRLEPVEAAQVLTAMHKAFAPRLVTITLADFQPKIGPRGTIVMTLGSLKSPGAGSAGKSEWPGRLVYGEGRSIPIRTTVEISERIAVAVAIRELSPSNPIGADDIEVREIDSFPRRSATSNPSGAVALRGLILGKAPRTTIRRGAVIDAGSLSTPFLIHHNEAVQVEFNAGGIQLKWKATAKASARLGEAIPVHGWTSMDGESSPRLPKLIRAVAIAPGRVRAAVAVKEDQKAEAEKGAAR